MKNKQPLIILSLLSAMSLSSCNIYSIVLRSSSSSSEASSIASSTGAVSTSSGGTSGSASSPSSSAQQQSSEQSKTSSGSSSSSSKSSSSSQGSGAKKVAVTSTINDYIENNVYELDNCPLQGNPKLLVVPVWFTDSGNYISSTKKDKVRSDIEKAYVGTEEEVGWESVKTYYEKASGGKCSINAVVTDWMNAGMSSTACTTDDKVISLVNKAVSNYKSQNSTKMTDFDTDKDGYLDGVMLIYGAPDYVSSNSSNENLWAYCYWQQDSKLKSVSNPGANVFFFASYDFMYGSNSGMGSYYYGDTSHASVDTHTFIHEMGHVFGLDDYYDYSSNGYSPAGGLTMQDCNVGCHDPYSLMALGWADPYVATDSCEVTLRPFQNGHDLLVLSPEFTGSPFDDYILVEYYTTTGLNEFDATYSYLNNSKYRLPSSSGVRVWHVDARLLYTTTGKFSADKVTTDPSTSLGNVYHMMSNTYYYSGDGSDGYISPLGSSYANYNLLQLIRNSTTATYKNKNNMTSSDFFKKGDTFSMSKFSKQFNRSGKLNNGKNLGFSFTVSSLDSSGVTLTVTKE